MNTNYSKIALLLALGVIAGDKVGAFNGDVANFPIRGLNDSTDSLLKIKNASEKMSADDIIEVASAKEAWGKLSEDMAGKGIVGKKLDGSQSDDLKVLNGSLSELIASDDSAKNVFRTIKGFTENILSDIKTIFATTVSSAALNAIDMNLSAKAEAEKILLKLSSESKFNDLFKSGKGILGELKQTELEKIKFRTKTTASINRALVTLRGDVFDALSKATTSVKIGSDTLDLAPLAEKIKLGLTTTVANLTDQISRLSVIGDKERKIIYPKNDQIKTVRRILGQLNFVDGGYDKVLNHIKSKGLASWLASFTSVKDVFVGSAKAGTAAVAVKEGAMFKSLEDLFGLSGASDASSSTTLAFKAYGAANQHIANLNRVTGSELAFAGLTDTDKFPQTLATGKSIEDYRLSAISKTGDEFTAGQIFDNAMSTISPYYSKTSYTPKNDRDVYFKSMIDATGVSDIPALTKYFDIMSEYDLKSFLDQNLEFVKRNKDKSNFAKQKEAIRKNLSSMQERLVDFAAENTKKLLSDNATSGILGVFEGKNKNTIQKVLDDVKDRISAILKEMGDAPAALDSSTATRQDAIAKVKTVKELLAMESIKSKFNKDILELVAKNADVAKEIKEITNEKTAQEMYTQMYNSLVKTGGKAAGADVDALKALFNDAVKTKLVDPVVVQEETEDQKEAKRLAELLAEDKKKGGRRSDNQTEDNEEVTLDDLDLVFLDPKTGKLIKKELLKEDDKKQKALTAAKNKAVAAAKDEIITKVYKAFNIKKAPAGKGKKAPAKRGSKPNAKGGRKRNRMLAMIKSRAGNRNDKKNEKK